MQDVASRYTDCTNAAFVVLSRMLKIIGLNKIRETATSTGSNPNK
jgi:hypothetical protein